MRESDAEDAPAAAAQLLVARVEIGLQRPTGAARRLSVASHHLSFPEAGRITTPLSRAFYSSFNLTKIRI
jgi:hypothetical protein